MRTHGWRRRMRVRRRVTDRGGRVSLLLVAASITVFPALAGCSLSSTPSTDYASNGYPYPTRSLVDYFKGSPDCPQPAQTAGPPPPNSSSSSDYATNGYPYPSQSLSDYFKNSSGSSDSPNCPPPTQAAGVPHPPSTYTPVSEPGYAAPPGSAATAVPPGSAATAAPAASVPPTDADPAASVYPQQSLADIFFKKPASQ